MTKILIICTIALNILMIVNLVYLIKKKKPIKTIIKGLLVVTAILDLFVGISLYYITKSNAITEDNISNQLEALLGTEFSEGDFSNIFSGTESPDLEEGIYIKYNISENTYSVKNDTLYVVSGDKVLITSSKDMIQYFEDNQGETIIIHCFASGSTIDDKQEMIITAYEEINDEE